MFVIRTYGSPDIGIGHLARCRRLADRLKVIGYTVHFLVDQVDAQIEEYLSGFCLHSLYPLGQSFQQEEEDAIQLLYVLSLSLEKVEAVLVDDYRLCVMWETMVARLGVPVIVIDDLNRNHFCDLLVDSKWEGEMTQCRYLGKIPGNAVPLLGPRYLLMDEAYAAGKPRPEQGGRGKSEDGVVQLMLSLGGGGDLSFLVKLLEQLLIKQPNSGVYRIRPVVGPFALHGELLRDFALQHSAIIPIEGRDSLYEELSETDLFIGAAGGTLFEALSLKIPSLTFSLSANQQNNRTDLEALGHYFHLDQISDEQFPELATLIWLMVRQIQRLQYLYHQPVEMEIDGLGVKRVIEQVDCLIREGTPLSVERDRLVVMNDAKSGSQLLHVDDRSINRYFQACNLKGGLQNMIGIKSVSYLSHYIWWLQGSQRESYEFQSNGCSLLYVWHQCVVIESVEVVIGGWFASSVICSPTDVMMALRRQLCITDRDYPGLPWLAVVHREDYLVRQINHHFGFEQIEPDEPFFVIAQSCIPKLAEEGFLCYMRR